MEIVFFSAIGLGLGYWVAPGAIMTEALRRGLTRHWRSVWFILLGALAGDALVALLSLLCTTLLLRNTLAHGLLEALETLVFLSLAWQSLKQGISKEQGTPTKTFLQGDIATGIFLAILSPYTLTFWLGVNGMAFSTLSLNAHTLVMVVFFTGFLLATLVWGLVLSVVTLAGHHFVSQGLLRWMNIGSGLVLGGFGIMTLVSLLTLLW